jgi:hypothetical protein
VVFDRGQRVRALTKSAQALGPGGIHWHLVEIAPVERRGGRCWRLLQGGEKESFRSVHGVGSGGMTIEARIWITRTTSKPSSEAILRLVQPRPCMRPTKSASAGAWGSDGSGIVAHRWSGHALNELPLNWAVQLGQGLVGQPAADCAGTAHGRVPSQFVREVRISRCELQFTNCELRLTLRLCWKSSNRATYEAWFADLADRKVKARILARIDRLALGIRAM